ncbi:MAG TPA: hypothetical protein VIM75_24555 [Ohtaekwangia sp.]|uniref:hypothetical protein n=1 Tax=Ohtaekwangia sp. TaxID=2066019 RepID=UPI002F945DCC
MQTEQLIISLIKDDLINHKLVSGLNRLGLNASDYHLHLSETIFRLMGIDTYAEDEKLQDRYIELTSTVEHVDLTKITGRTIMLDTLVRNIYNELFRRKP